MLLIPMAVIIMVGDLTPSVQVSWKALGTAPRD